MYHFFRHTIFYCTRHTFKLHTTLLYKINYSSPHSKLDTKHERQTVSCRTPLSFTLQHLSNKFQLHKGGGNGPPCRTPTTLTKCTSLGYLPLFSLNSPHKTHSWFRKNIDFTSKRTYKISLAYQGGSVFEYSVILVEHVNRNFLLSFAKKNICNDMNSMKTQHMTLKYVATSHKLVNVINACQN